MNTTKVSAIAAISSQRRALGYKNELLWRIAEDLKRVRRLTMNHPLIMGRKTMDHILATAGHALPGRTNIVVTRDTGLRQEGFEMVYSLEEALEFAKQSPGGNEEVFIFGGAQIFEMALPKTDRLYLTIVYDEPEADAFFPDYSEFTNVIEKSNEIKSAEGVRYRYLTLERDTALHEGK